MPNPDEWELIDALPEAPKYVCYRVAAEDGEALADALNGRLDKEIWQQAPWTEDFIDIEGAKRPSQKTRAKMLWSDAYFFVGAEIHETHIWGTLTQHNSTMYHENDFEVFIDPDRTHHSY